MKHIWFQWGKMHGLSPSSGFREGEGWLLSHMGTWWGGGWILFLVLPRYFVEQMPRWQEHVVLWQPDVSKGWWCCFACASLHTFLEQSVFTVAPMWWPCATVWPAVFESPDFLLLVGSRLVKRSAKLMLFSQTKHVARIRIIVSGSIVAGVPSPCHI